MFLGKKYNTETQRHGEKRVKKLDVFSAMVEHAINVIIGFKNKSVVFSAPLCLCVSMVVQRLLCPVLMAAALIFGMGAGLSFAGEKWPGIDEAVVNRIAREHGRDARKPLINTGEGDLQLFMFLMAGAVGGFVAGYYWRVLLEGKKNRDGNVSR
jgi:hypothetical protein